MKAHPALRGGAVLRAVALGLAVFLFSIPAAWAVSDYLEKMDKLDEAVSLPAFDLKDLNGQPVRSADMTGKKIILMAFWSMYCKACVEKFDSLVKIRAKYAPDRVEVVSVNTDGEYKLPAETLREFLRGLENREDFKINFPVIYEGGDALAAKLGIVFLPAVIAVSKEGKIVGIYRRYTEDSDEEILRGIETIIPEEGREPPP